MELSRCQCIGLKWDSTKGYVQDQVGINKALGPKSVLVGSRIPDGPGVDLAGGKSPVWL